MIDACTWDHPGTDPYMGNFAAAVAAYHFPVATQAALIDAWERRDFTDTVVIDRDSIRGKTYDYDSDIREMHFGSRGRICRTTTRAGWSPMHVESAIVLCADGECIGVPAVCRNLFRLTRSEPGGGAAFGDGYGELPRGIDAAEAFAPLREIAAQAGPSAMTVGGAPGYAPFVYAPGLVAFVGLAPVIPPVSEYPSWLLLLVGLVAVGLWRVRK